MDRDSILKSIGAKENKLRDLKKKRDDMDRNMVRLDDQIFNLEGEIEFEYEKLENYTRN